ncbi:EamA family transporter [Paenibacillus dokdonensis]|uniref:EamA family transporter n=1 Tax=Paenibacillus dokdonensis TaxID=2567944 RepID=A0ABU6GKU1_9BACL|nr:EamA family transporter [Paenibacillus dokdonensis]MEC0240354.1 EamA family transporter [Paenibacillus dokdonensis]
MAYFLLLLNIMLLVAGQIVWKMGLQAQSGLHVSSLLSVVFSPLILLGLALYAIATGLWFVVLSRLPLSLAYPLQSLAYAIGIFAAWYIFGESIPLNRWIGAGVIVMGAVIIAVK